MPGSFNAGTRKKDYGQIIINKLWGGIMKRLFLTLALVLVPVLSFAVTDQEVRDMMIKESISSYPGNCPCPYLANGVVAVGGVDLSDFSAEIRFQGVRAVGSGPIVIWQARPRRLAALSAPIYPWPWPL